MPKKAAKPKLTDAERHARFVEMAKKVEASEDPAEFDRVMGKLDLKAKPGKKPE